MTKARFLACLLVTTWLGCPSGDDDDLPTPVEPAAPAAAVISITPDDPRTADALALSIDTPATDADGDLTTHSVAWFLDGAEQAELADAEEVASDRTAKGQVWRVEVTDGDSGGREATATAEVTVLNTPPSFTTVTILPEDPDTTELLVTDKAGWSDADGDPETYEYVWTVDGVSSGTDGATLEPEASARDQAVEVTVTPVDGEDAGEALTASTTILNSAPTAPSLFVAPTGAIGGEDPLVCTIVAPGTDLDDDALTYVFDWTVDGADYPESGGGWVGPTATNHPGDTVPAQDSAPGEEWTCSAYATDGAANSDVATATLGAGFDQVPDFSLTDVNTASATYNQAVSPRDYLQKVSGWYFGHAT